MARPSKFTEETKNAIIEAVSIGATYKAAAGAGGVDYTTFNNWMNKGEKAKSGQFFEFFHAVEIAKQKAFYKYTKTIATAAAKGDWRAAESFLKRRDPDNWGDRQNLDHTSKGERLTWAQFIQNADTESDSE